MIDQSLCKHNIVRDEACMMCGKKMNKTEAKIAAAIAGIEKIRQEPDYVSPLRSETDDRYSDQRGNDAEVTA